MSMQIPRFASVAAASRGNRPHAAPRPPTRLNQQSLAAAMQAEAEQQRRRVARSRAGDEAPTPPTGGGRPVPATESRRPDPTAWAAGWTCGCDRRRGLRRPRLVHRVVRILRGRRSSWRWCGAAHRPARPWCLLWNDELLTRDAWLEEIEARGRGGSGSASNGREQRLAARRGRGPALPSEKRGAGWSRKRTPETSAAAAAPRRPRPSASAGGPRLRRHRHRPPAAAGARRGGAVPRPARRCRRPK